VISASPFQVTGRHNDDCKRLLRLMGVPVVEVSLLLLSSCQITLFFYFSIQIRFCLLLMSSSSSMRGQQNIDNLLNLKNSLALVELAYCMLRMF
jgi:hypothetical protein